MKITDFHYRFECPPIVDESLFHKVQMRMKDILERKNQINRTQHEYLLRNYLYCNECKNGMSGLWREKLNQFNYFCSNRTRVWKGYKNGKEKCTMRRSLSIKQTDFLVWETICDTLENSSTLKESFKSTQLDTKFKSDKEVKNEVRRVRHNIQRISREINDLNENILLIEKQKWTNKMDEKTYKEVKSSIMEKIDKNRDTKDKELMKEVFGEVLQKIFVDWDVETKEHVLDIRLKLPLFNDKIEYIDKTNKSLGYKLKDGKKSKELRYKKTNNVKRFIESKKKI
jgi:hypothetical protein